ncbi:MAG: energy transducer TonB [Bacteroidales bacterium]|nr:energy transducer TonB [Bacteroidales bacterium]
MQTPPSAPVSPTPSIAKQVTSPPHAKEDSHNTSKNKLIAIAATCIAALLILFFVLRGCGGDKNDLPEALTFEVNGVPFNMVYIEGGTVTIPELSEEFPSQEVTLDGFYVGETEVTPNLWAAVMGDEEINSHNIELFIDRLNEETGISFCLPSMAQWWYAAQGDVLPRLVIDIPEDRSILEPFRTEGVKLIPSSGAATDGKEVEEAVTDDERPAEVEDEIVVAEDYSEVTTTLSEAKQDVAVSENDKVISTTVTHDEVEEDEEIYSFVEVQPSFPGGDNALYSYLRNNIKKPQAARDNGITGTVYVSFVVERDGSLSNVSVMRDIGGGCGGEAVRVVKSMPRWNPGKNRGKAVRTRYNLPIQF